MTTLIAAWFLWIISLFSFIRERRECMSAACASSCAVDNAAPAIKLSATCSNPREAALQASTLQAMRHIIVSTHKQHRATHAANTWPRFRW